MITTNTNSRIKAHENKKKELVKVAREARVNRFKTLSWK